MRRGCTLTMNAWPRLKRNEEVRGHECVALEANASRCSLGAAGQWRHCRLGRGGLYAHAAALHAQWLLRSIGSLGGS